MQTVNMQLSVLPSTVLQLRLLPAGHDCISNGGAIFPSNPKCDPMLRQGVQCALGMPYGTGTLTELQQKNRFWEARDFAPSYQPQKPPW